MDLPRLPHTLVTGSLQERGAATKPNDLESFRDLYENAQPRIYSYFLSRCHGSRELALDLTQETFVSAFRSFQAGQVMPREPIAWLTTIARRRLVDHYRRQNRSPLLASGRNISDVGSHQPSSTIPTTEIEVRLESALARLPTKQMVAVVLRYMDDLSVQEVADLLGVSYRAAESAIRRGRRGIAKELERGSHE